MIRLKAPGVFVKLFVPSEFRPKELFVDMTYVSWEYAKNIGNSPP